MLVGPFHGYRLKDLNDTSFLTPEQLELLTAQVPLGLDLAIDPHAFTFDDNKEVIAALLQMPNYSFTVSRYKSGQNVGQFVADVQLFQHVWHSGSGYGPNYVSVEAATIPELLTKVRDTLLADLTKYLAPLGFTVQLKS
jgi:hypothetical protein